MKMTDHKKNGIDIVKEAVSSVISANTISDFNSNVDKKIVDAMSDFLNEYRELKNMIEEHNYPQDIGSLSEVQRKMTGLSMFLSVKSVDMKRRADSYDTYIRNNTAMSFSKIHQDVRDLGGKKNVDGITDRMTEMVTRSLFSSYFEEHEAYKAVYLLLRTVVEHANRQVINIDQTIKQLNFEMFSNNKQ